MVAALAPQNGHPLIFEPDPRPLGVGGIWHGWRNNAVRCHEDDAWGAAVQWIIVRYAAGETGRAQLAQEFSVSERQIQEYVSGRAWKPYSGPVLRAMARLGIGVLKRGRARRHQEMMRGMANLAGDVLALLAHDHRPLAARARGDLQLVASVSGMCSMEAPADGR